MLEYESGCPKRVNHFLKVYSFAKLIAKNEGVDNALQELIEIVSVLHDMGIKPSLEKYNSSSGKYQEQEGPAVAQAVLKKFDVSEKIIERVCFLIANHHHYDKIEGLDYQILVEADFLVNIYEDSLNKEQILNIKSKYFKTKSGIDILDKLYLINSAELGAKEIRKKTKKIKLDIKKMGVNIDKNEYQEIVLSQSNHPERYK